MKKLKTTSFFLVTVTVGLVLTLSCSTELEKQHKESISVFPNPDWVQAESGRIHLKMKEGASIANLLGNTIKWEKSLIEFDGFSPLQPILIPVNGVCPSLPHPGQEADSISDQSPVILFDSTRQTRIPWFGEAGEDPSYCEIFPLRPFADHSMVFVLITGTFDAEATGIPGDQPQIPAAAAPGISLTGYWAFPAGSLANRRQPAYTLVAESLQSAGSNNLVSINKDLGKDILKSQEAILYWTGSYRVPWWLDAKGRIRWQDGKPVQQGYTTEEFYLIVPATVTAETTIPLIQYGHGLFGDPREIQYGSQKELRDKVAGVFAGVAWGMAVRYFAHAIQALADPDKFETMQDIVFQSFVNQVLFSKVLKDEIAPLVAAAIGQPVSSVVDYIGISQGGILGSPVAALSPYIRNMLLHVGGGNWTPMMTHSSNWVSDNSDDLAYGDIVSATVPDAVERTLLMALWQSYWDRFDPALFADAWLQKPVDMPGPGPEKNRRVLYAYSIDDPQVPNFSSETVMRAAEMPLLTPSITEPQGISILTYQDSIPAVVANQWDVGGGEAAHANVRSLPAFVEQARIFVRTGKVVDTCNAKTCRFEP